METIAKLIIAGSALSLLCLLLLHFVSPEFSPGWRMISEYALGKYKWLLTSFFVLWGISSVLTALLLWNNVTAWWAMLGVVLIFISGIGAIMGGLFDLNHKLHGTAFAIGVPTLPVGALLVSYHLVKSAWWAGYKMPILLSAHATWITIVLMAVTMMLLFSGFKNAGIPLGPNVEPPKALPQGVIGINGYANRLLVVCFIAWILVVAGVYLKRPSNISATPAEQTSVNKN
jgi:hypothetical protein